MSRYYIKGEHEGKSEVFAHNLPGLPDNIRLSSHGGYWVGLAMKRTQVTDLLGKYPRARNFLVKVNTEYTSCFYFKKTRQNNNNNNNNNKQTPGNY